MASSSPRFAQLVIGPPGSGKSTYCKAMQDFMSNMGREVVIANIDPANDCLPYECAIDISELITVQDVMENLQMGPNGGLVYCMEYLETNSDWLVAKTKKLPPTTYILFDLPGQVELYTHHKSVRNMILAISKTLDLRFCAVHLVDSYYCTEATKFISVLLTSLCSMLQMELPHINVLSKVDLVEQYGRLDFNIDFYTEVLDLEQLLSTCKEDAFRKKYKSLNEKIVGLVDDYSLVSFLPFSVKEQSMMGNVMAHVDKANGYIYSKAEDDAMRQMYSAATSDRIATVREKYMHLDD